MKNLLLLVSLMFSSLSYAEVCTGKVERLGVSPTGADVLIQIQPSTGIFSVCNLDATVGTISTEVCKSIYSTLLAARMAEKEVSLHYPESVTCSSLGSWGYAVSAPTFIEIEQNF